MYRLYQSFARPVVRTKPTLGESVFKVMPRVALFSIVCIPSLLTGSVVTRLMQQKPSQPVKNSSQLNLTSVPQTHNVAAAFTIPVNSDYGLNQYQPASGNLQASNVNIQ